MAQQFKSLMQQLHPFLNPACTLPPPPPTAKSSKHLFGSSVQKLAKTHLRFKTRSPSTPITNNVDAKLMESIHTPVSLKQTFKIKQLNADTDSGVDTTSSNYLSSVNTNIIIHNRMVMVCDCLKCATRNAQRVQIEKTLKHAFVNYLHEPTEQAFANMPLLVSKSYKPSSKHQNSSRQLDQIEVRKSSAVNALFMKDNKWVYVKTCDNVKGFIPKKCLEPLMTKSCPNASIKKNTTSSPIKLPTAPKTVPPSKITTKQQSQIDHTYMTINENDLIGTKKTNKKLNLESVDELNNISNLDCNNSDTDLALLSVSCFDLAANSSTRSPRFSKNLMQKFIDCDDQSRSRSPAIKSNRSSKDLFRMLAKSKSRNRHLSVAFKHLSTEATLTMLEQDVSRNYVNLNECGANVYQNISNSICKQRGRITAISEESYLSNKRGAEYMFNYENLCSFKSLKRVKKQKISRVSASSSFSSPYESPSTSSCSSQPRQLNSNCVSYHYDALNSVVKDVVNEETSKLYLNESIDEATFPIGGCFDEEHVYNHLSSNNSKVLNMFRILDDYTADFKGDLSVRKGDVVYLIETAATSPCPVKNNDWLFVRIYKRNLNVKLTPDRIDKLNNNTSKSTKPEYQAIQGYIPRSYATKI